VCKIYDTSGLFVVNMQEIKTEVFEGIKLTLFLYLYVLCHSAEIAFSYFKLTIYEIVLPDRLEV